MRGFVYTTGSVVKVKDPFGGQPYTVKIKTFGDGHYSGKDENGNLHIFTPDMILPAPPPTDLPTSETDHHKINA